MKTEKYLLEHILNNHISLEQIETDTGINIEQMVRKKKDLKAGEFLALCTYLGITPEEVSDRVLQNR